MEKKNTNALTNNVVSLNGEIISNGEFNHEVFGEKFYMYTLSVKRLSGNTDEIPLVISERLIKPEELTIGTKITVSGQFRSYNVHEENGKNKLILFVFVREIILEEKEKCNNIKLKGHICKPPVYRTTPLGREIADVLIAVNRPYGKSDYIPCICWGRNAKFTGELNVGDCIEITGRIQSRTYKKKISETEAEERKAYEVSVTRVTNVAE